MYDNNRVIFKNIKNFEAVHETCTVVNTEKRQKLN